jgi:sulfur relay (sulfurtransferase) complex TusBCD TusD component (DsrE family)
VQLLVLLYSGPRTEGARTAAELGMAALRKGHGVSVFLAGEGTFHVDALAPLREAGARVVFCSADAAVRGWDRLGTAGRGSFVDLGDLAAEADHVVTL